MFAAGCELNGLRQRMYDQPKFEPLEATDFFSDGRSSRPLVEGTVPRKTFDEDAPLLPDDPMLTGKDADGNMLAGVPLKDFDLNDLVRGREQYEIYCGVCHGNSGHADGMVVRRGYKAPPSFHIDRLRAVGPAYFYTIGTNGYGQMQPYNDQISVEDRWRIGAYIKALQMSQNFALPDGVSVEDLIKATHNEDDY